MTSFPKGTAGEYPPYMGPAPSNFPAPFLSQPNIPQPTIKSQDIFALSHASQDQPSYYSPPSSPKWGATTCRPSNRGNKLNTHHRARNLIQCPPSDRGFPEFHSLLPSSLLEGKLTSSEGFPIAPNFHLLQRHVLDAPTPSVLPPPPQNPLDILLTPSTQRILGPRNKTFKDFAIGITGLIEQEAELCGALERVSSYLRGDVGWEDENKKRPAESDPRENSKRIKTGVSSNGIDGTMVVRETEEDWETEEHDLENIPLPSYAGRLIDAELFIRERFVTREPIEMTIPIAVSPGSEGDTRNALTGVNGVGGIGYTASASLSNMSALGSGSGKVEVSLTNEVFSPNEQEVVLHECMTDIHRFFADCQEYRTRLGELRDGLLNIDRRRKAMWKILRTLVASEWVEPVDE